MVKRRISFRRVLSSFHRIVAYQFFLALFVIALSLSSCYNEPEFIGKNLLPISDLKSVKLDTSFQVSAYTASTDTIPTGYYNYAVLGTYNSEIFGKTKSDFLTQITHGAAKDTLGTMSPRPAADSIFMYLRLAKAWGDVNKSINIKVYELSNELAPNSTKKDATGKDFPYTKFVYYNGRELTVDGKYIPTLINSEPVTYNGTQKVLKIKLTQSFADKLTNAPDTTFSDHIEFIKYLKGLYITSEDFGTTGGVLYSFNYSLQVVLHYHYFSTKKQRDSLRTITYYTSSNLPRFNRIIHDYSTATSALKIKHIYNYDSLSNNNVTQDTMFYISGLGGVRGVIKLNGVSEWAKKMPIAINRAELRIDVQDKDSIINPLLYYSKRDTDTSSYKGYNAVSPYDIVSLYDYSITQVQTARYSKPKKYYSIDITFHLQNLLKGKIKRDYFYLEPSDFKVNYKEGIFRTGKNSNRIKLIITYSKL